MPLLEPRHAQELAPIRDALSRLQMHYVQNGPGGAPAGQPGATPGAGAPGPAAPQAPRQPEPPKPPPSRLWIPGQ